MGKLILLVDDDPDILKMTGEVLTALGHSVVGMSDYYAGLAAWSEREGAFDLAILDYVLQDRTGVELAEYFWSEKPLLAIIMTTGFSANLLPIEDTVRARLRFLDKPFTIPALRQTIKEVFHIAE